MSRPMISIVMPLFNNMNEVGRGVRSVLAQTVSDFELLVVNDGSTDGSEKIVQMFPDPRVRIVHQKNAGVSVARNRGIEESKGELVALLDADDEWKPDFLETITRLHQSWPVCSVFATHYLYKNVDGSIESPVLRRVPPGSWEGILENYFEVAAHSDPPLCSSAVAVRRAALLAIGGFPEGIAIGEDLLTWARLAVKYRIAYSKKLCAVFWLRGALTGHPTRVPEIPDLVGGQLLELLPQVNPAQQRDFYRYAGMWHRMRASMFVQSELPRQALEEVRKIRRYSRVDPQAAVYFLLAKTPKSMRKFVLRIFTFIRNHRRRILLR